MNKFFYAAALACLSNSTFAMFCPTGFNEMNFGDTIEQVTQSCGKPDSQQTTKSAPGKPQEWNYYVKADPNQPGTLKMSVAFDDSGKAINISVNGTSVVTTPICNGANISYGSTTEQVKSSCGKPAFINESPQQNITAGATSSGTTSNGAASDGNFSTSSSNTASSTGPETETTTFTYSTSPPTTLIFINGKLKERK